MSVIIKQSGRDVSPAKPTEPFKRVPIQVDMQLSTFQFRRVSLAEINEKLRDYLVGKVNKDNKFHRTYVLKIEFGISITNEERGSFLQQLEEVFPRCGLKGELNYCIDEGVIRFSPIDNYDVISFFFNSLNYARTGETRAKFSPRTLAILDSLFITAIWARMDRKKELFMAEFPILISERRGFSVSSPYAYGHGNVETKDVVIANVTSQELLRQFDCKNKGYVLVIPSHLVPGRSQESLKPEDFGNAAVVIELENGNLKRPQLPEDYFSSLGVSQVKWIVVKSADFVNIRDEIEVSPISRVEDLIVDVDGSIIINTGAPIIFVIRATATVSVKDGKAHVQFEER